jgi:hypothetical protein
VGRISPTVLVRGMANPWRGKDSYPRFRYRLPLPGWRWRARPPDSAEKGGPPTDRPVLRMVPSPTGPVPVPQEP